MSCIDGVELGVGVALDGGVALGAGVGLAAADAPAVADGVAVPGGAIVAQPLATRTTPMLQSFPTRDGVVIALSR
jgi:hypothetical protein